VYLLDTPLDNTYKNQLHFSTLSEQTQYFLGREKINFHNVTYQRKDNTIKVGEHIDTLWKVNYVMYQNANFNNKWFYAFITKMEYVNDNMTLIYIETDVYQTWLFECTLLPSFVVREHSETDEIGEHLLDEGLEHGEYIMQTYNPVGKMGEIWNIVALSDLSPLGSTEETIGNIYGNVCSGLAYWAFPITEEGVEDLKTLLSAYSAKPEAIVMIFTVPKLVIPSVTIKGPVPNNEVLGVEMFSINKSYSNVDGYTPKNKKLFSYPYKYLYVSNNCGQSATYRYEDFNGFDPYKMDFQVYGSISPNPTIAFSPVDYKGNTPLKYEYDLTLAGFPMCSWSSDAYTAWLAQNVGGIALSTIGSAGAMIGGAFMGNALVVAGGAMGVASQLASVYQHSIQPDQAKGQINSGSLRMATYSLDFYTSHMSIKAGYASLIDNYFTMYGYKTLKVKVPNTNVRPYWTYTQTIDVNIDGAIPSDDMSRLKKMYNEGVTFWKSASYFCDYSKDNTV
jgi:hypothetical protein